MAGFDLAGTDRVHLRRQWGSAEGRRLEINQLQVELTTKTRQVAPLKDLPQKVHLASQQIAEFYKKRVPEQNSQLYAELGKLTAANGVTIGLR